MSELSQIIELLRSDLYERVPSQEDNDLNSMKWVSPLGIKVRIGGNRNKPIITVWDSRHKRLLGPIEMTATELDRVLP